MKKTIKSLFLIILSTLLCISSGGCSSGTSEDAVVIYGDFYTEEALYSYWLSTYKYYFLTSYNDGVDSDEFWDAEADDGRTNEEYVLDYVLDEVKNRTIALALFDEYGLKLSDSQTKAIDADIDEKLEYIGSRQEMNAELSRLNMNIDMLREVYIINAKYDKLINYLYGDEGVERVTDKELAKEFEDNYHALKLITIYSDFTPKKDEEGNYVFDETGEIELTELSDSEKLEKAELINEIAGELDAGTDFDVLIKKYSEADYSSMPNGIFVSSGDYTSYGADVVNAALELKEGEYRILSDSVSTLIVQKSPLPEYSSLTDTELETLSSLEERAQNRKKKNKFEALYDDVTVKQEVIASYNIRTAKKNSYY